jgi:hypothetical protein
MNKNLDTGDILNDARNCIECMWMAASDLLPEDREPIRTVATMAREKIDEAIARLEECPAAANANPVPAAPSA